MSDNFNHVVFYSGGAGSYATTYRILNDERYGVDIENLHLVFTDTQIEDKSLYKFLLQTFQSFYGKDNTHLLKLNDELVEVYEDIDKRKEQLTHLSRETMKVYPNVHWMHYELNGIPVAPWDIFFRQRFIGNSRVANCSTILKQRMARDFIKDYFDKDTTKVYFGIDWQEEHRTKAPIENWSKYSTEVIFPLCNEPFIYSDDKWALMRQNNIDVPELYIQGFSHNNCGGFCVRAGQGHFKNLLEKNPKLFNYHEKMEERLSNEIKVDIGDIRTILKRTVNGKQEPLPLSKLRQIVTGEDTQSGEIDEFEFGGCGCFVTDDELDEEDIKFSVRDLKLVYK